MAEADEEQLRDTPEFKVRAIVEVFGGRFDEGEIEYLLQRRNYDIFDTVNFIMKREPQEIRQELVGYHRWTTIRRRKELRRNRPKLQRAMGGKIETSVRQFACKACDSVWWRRVPLRKEVSKCKKCRTKFDPVPRDKEWGIGEFVCSHNDCGNVFRGWARMGYYCVCYQCGTKVYPTKIFSPDQDQRPGASKYEHHCELCPIVGECPHPHARRREGFKVLVPSNVHESTGSTVATFLPQNDLASELDEDVYDRLTSINEDDESIVSESIVSN